MTRVVEGAKCSLFFYTNGRKNMEDQEREDRDLYLRKAIFNLEKQISFYNEESDALNRKILVCRKDVKIAEANFRVSNENGKAAKRRLDDLMKANKDITE